MKAKLSLVDPNMARVFIPWAIRHPRYIFSFRKLIKSYKKSVFLRRENLSAEGIKIPPFLIMSITKQCNLKCAGCYAAANGTLNNENIHQLQLEEWRRIIKEGNELGVFAYIIAGGEPFLFKGLLELCKENKDRLFIIFSNGTAIKDHHLKLLKKMTNTAVIVSIEGRKEEHDGRRGDGVYVKVMQTLKKLNKIGILNGISVTINALNYKYWIEEKAIDNLIEQGIRIGFFLEYIPTKPGGIESYLMLSDEERATFRKMILKNRKEKKIYLVHSPGDEELMGGCVSAGRGFAHVTPGGDLTPCPVTNLATHNLKSSSLKQALASPFFKFIRENEGLLETEGVPCALFAHQEELQKIVKNVGAYTAN